MQDSRSWYAVQTKNRKEKLVMCQLREEGIPFYHPRLLVPRRNGTRVEPLFPNYLFARVGNVEESVKVRYTPGVRRVLGYGDEPCPVDEELIGLFRSREGEAGYVRPSSVFRFEENDRVRLRGGVLQGLEAIFQRYVPARRRVQVLLTLLGRRVQVELDPDRVAPRN